MMWSAETGIGHNFEKIKSPLINKVKCFNIMEGLPAHLRSLPRAHHQANHHRGLQLHSPAGLRHDG